MKINPLPPLETVRELLSYDGLSGEFRWIAPGKGKRVGDLVGWRNPAGYLRIKIAQRLYHASRLAWLLAHGVDPVGEIDHRDGDPTNNRIVNLREATRAQNGQNRGPAKTNTSGFKGAYFDASDGRWKMRIWANGKRTHHGPYDSAEDAARAHDMMAIRLHGAFAHLNFPADAVHDAVHDFRTASADPGGA